jgi:hypothetical protein
MSYVAPIIWADAFARERATYQSTPSQSATSQSDVRHLSHHGAQIGLNRVSIAVRPGVEESSDRWLAAA